MSIGQAFRYRFSPGVVLAAALYNFSFILIYRCWLSDVFAYFGLTYHAPSALRWALAWGMALAPSLGIRVDRFRASGFMSTLLYLLVFVPSIWVPMFMALRSPGEIITFQAWLLAGFLLTAAAQWLRIPTLRRLAVPWRPRPGLLPLGYALLVLVVLAGHHFRIEILDFKDIYDLRRENNLDNTSPVVLYLQEWLCYVINPLILALGLKRRRLKLIAAGVAAEVLMYGLVGAKGVVLLVPMLLGIHWLYHTDIRRLTIRLVGGMAAGVIGLFAFSQAFWGNPNDPSFIHDLEAILYLRTLAIAGMLSAQYQDFFLNHPLTWFSHSRIGALFHEFPYSQPLGIIIGNYYYGSTEFNANAHYLVTDGFSAFGHGGLVFAGLFGLAVFYAVDVLTDGLDQRLALSLLAFPVISMANISLLTTLATGGLLWLMILFAFDLDLLRPPPRRP